MDFHYDGRRVKVGSSDNGLGTNRLLSVNRKGEMQAALDIGDAMFSIIPAKYNDEDGYEREGLLLSFTNNSDVAGKVYNFLKEESSFEWGLIEYKETNTGKVVSRVGTSFIQDRELVVINFSLGHELLPENLTRKPLSYWKHTHNHPSGPNIPSKADLNAFDVVRRRYPNAVFDIIR